MSRKGVEILKIVTHFDSTCIYGKGGANNIGEEKVGVEGGGVIRTIF